MPDKLLGCSPDDAGDAIILPECYRRKIRIDFAVTDEQNIIAARVVIILGTEDSLLVLSDVLRDNELLKEPQGSSEQNGCRQNDH